MAMVTMNVDALRRMMVAKERLDMNLPLSTLHVAALLDRHPKTVLRDARSGRFPRPDRRDRRAVWWFARTIRPLVDPTIAPAAGSQMPNPPAAERSA
jgi:hypothetical protein